jgi:serine/threonine protein kinase
LAEIKSWLERFCQKQQQGKLMRGLQMCNNALRAAVGIDTSFDKLKDLTAHLERHVSQLQGLETLGMGAKMNEVICQQQMMMEKVNKLLEAGMRSGGSGLDDHAVQQIGEAYGMVAVDVRMEVQRANEALLAIISQRLNQQHDEVMAKLERMTDLLKVAAETSSQSIIEQLEYFPWSMDEWVRRGGDAEDDEEERSELGRGAFATTSRMRGKGGMKLAGHVVAVKKIDLKAALKNHGVTRDDIESEVKVLEGLKHPNVIKIHASHEDPRKHLYIVLELAEGGSLDAVIKARPRPTVEKVMRIMSQTVNALVYIHQMRVQHRDIKPENILLSKGGNVKLTDFGLAKMSTSSAASMAGTKVGTFNYFSPEKMHGAPYDGKDDVWALGVVFVELGMCTRLDGPIWHDSPEMRTKREGLIRSVASASPEISAWVRKMLQVDHRQRCTAEQLMIIMKSGPGNPQVIVVDTINYKQGS